MMAPLGCEARRMPSAQLVRTAAIQACAPTRTARLGIIKTGAGDHEVEDLH